MRWVETLGLAVADLMAAHLLYNSIWFICLTSSRSSCNCKAALALIASSRSALSLSLSVGGSRLSSASYIGPAKAETCNLTIHQLSINSNIRQ